MDSQNQRRFSFGPGKSILVVLAVIGSLIVIVAMGWSIFPEDKKFEQLLEFVAGSSAVLGTLIQMIFASKEARSWASHDFFELFGWAMLWIAALLVVGGTFVN